MQIKQNGFSLIELMIALVIMGILASIAYPSYLSELTKSRRAEAQVALLDLSTRMEQYYAEHNTYAGATLNALAMPSRTQNGYYHLAIVKNDGHTFNLNAVPNGPQAKNDTLCGALSLNQTGIRGAGGKGGAMCW